jgi:N-acyl-D-aspartate/D-glutamate deacylase
MRLLLTLGVSGVVAFGAARAPLAQGQAGATTNAPQSAAAFVQQAGGLTAASARRTGEGLGPFKTLTIRGVMLIDGTGAPPAGPMNITVEGNRITRIQAAGTPGVQQTGRQGGRGAAPGAGGQAQAPAADGTYVLDATGMYLMPGFIDMHVHAGGAPKNADAEYAYKLWLAHGVTTVRGVPLGPTTSR